MGKTLTTIETEVAYRLGDSAFGIWAAAEIDGYIKEAYDLWALATECLWKRVAHATDIAHTATYALPTDFLKLERVTQKNMRIEPITRPQAVAWDYRFETLEGQVVAWMLDGDGLLTLRKIRIPSVAGVSGDTKIEYFRRGATLSAGSTQVEIPDYMTKYLRFYAMYRCMEREGEGQDIKGADRYKTRYEQGVGRALERRDRFHATRISVLGGGEGRRLRKPPRPVLPSNFPK